MRKIKEVIKNKKNPKAFLKQAILDGNLTLVQDFLNNNYFNINEVDEHYHTLLDYALIKANQQIIEFLIERNAKLGILLYQVDKEEDFIAKIKLLHNSGYDLNNLDKLGFAAIHYASSLGFGDAIKLLMEYKVKILKTAINGESPVRFALKEPRVGIFIGRA